MTQSTGTEANSQDDASTREAVPLADESLEDGGKPGDGWVKKSQMIAALNSATQKYDALQAKVNQLEAKTTAKEEVKPPTAAELRRYVEAGELSQDQADLLLKKQLTDEVTREVESRVANKLSAAERAKRVGSELSGYKDLVPDAWVPGSQERAKAEKEFAHLVSLGHPSTPETEAAALRAAFGDLETLRASKSATPGTADRHSETGGGKPPGDAGGRTKDPLKSLSPEKKAYYQKGIDAGRYKGWDDVKKEIEFSPRKSA